MPTLTMLHHHLILVWVFILVLPVVAQPALFQVVPGMAGTVTDVQADSSAGIHAPLKVTYTSVVIGTIPR